MHLGQLAGRPPPSAPGPASGTDRPASATSRCGASKKTTLHSSAAAGSSSRARSGPLRGRNPRKRKRSPGSPAAESAVATAEGPGTGTTGIRRRGPAATSAAPGSLTAGVPASETRAMSRPRAQDVEQTARAGCHRNGRESSQGWAGPRGAEKPPGPPGILGGDDGHLRQQLRGAGRQVAEVAERSGDDEQSAGRHGGTAEWRQRREAEGREAGARDLPASPALPSAKSRCCLIFASSAPSAPRRPRYRRAGRS